VDVTSHQGEAGPRGCFTWTSKTGREDERGRAGEALSFLHILLTVRTRTLLARWLYRRHGRCLQDAAFEAPIEQFANEPQQPVRLNRRGAIGHAIEHLEDIAPHDGVYQPVLPIAQEIAFGIALLPFSSPCFSASRTLDEVARDGLERIGLLQLLCLEDGVVSFRDLNECIARLLAGLGEGELRVRAKGEALLSRAARPRRYIRTQLSFLFRGCADRNRAAWRPRFPGGHRGVAVAFRRQALSVLDANPLLRWGTTGVAAVAGLGAGSRHPGEGASASGFCAACATTAPT